MSGQNSVPAGAIEAPDIVYWSSLGRAATVKQLLASGGNANVTDAGGYSALAAASENNHLEIVKLLIAHGANVNYKNGIHTALSLAKAAGHKEVVEFLISKGGKVVLNMSIDSDPQLQDCGFAACFVVRSSSRYAAKR